MSVGALSENPYAYLERLHEGGATIHHNPTTDRSAPTPVAATDEAVPAKEGEDFAMFGKDGFGFDDFLDIINPLQHIPLISTLYREITGDEISAGSRMIGGGIFGGGIGLAASVVNTAIEAQTGKDVGEHVVAMFDGDETADPVQLAATTEAAAVTTNVTAANAATTGATAATPAMLNAAPAPTDPSLSMIMPASLMQNAASKHSASVEPAAASDPAKGGTASAAAQATGLEWKNSPATNIHQTIEKIRNQNGDNLTSDQLARIIGSFKQPAPIGAIEPKPLKANHKPDTVSDITPTNRTQALNSYDKGANIAATSQKSYYAFGNEAMR